MRKDLSNPAPRSFGMASPPFATKLFAAERRVYEVTEGIRSHRRYYPSFQPRPKGAKIFSRRAAFSVPYTAC